MRRLAASLCLIAALTLGRAALPCAGSEIEPLSGAPKVFFASTMAGFFEAAPGPLGDAAYVFLDSDEASPELLNEMLFRPADGQTNPGLTPQRIERLLEACAANPVATAAKIETLKQALAALPKSQDSGEFAGKLDLAGHVLHAALDSEAARRDPAFQAAWEAEARKAGERKVFDVDRIGKMYRQLQWMKTVLPSERMDAIVAGHQRRSVDVLTQDFKMSPEELRSVLPPLGNVVAAFQEAPHDNTHKAWDALGDKLGRMNRAEIGVIGQLYRSSMTKKWKPLDQLERARTPEDFALAVAEIAPLTVERERLSRQADQAVLGGQFQDAHKQALASLDAAAAVRMAGLIAADKDYSSYHGKSDAAVDEFSRYLAGHPRNSADFINVRKYEFRDHLQIVLMFAEALAIANRDETAEALATATNHWIKAANGILSFSRLPLQVPIDIARRLLEPLFRQNPRVRRAVEEGLKYAESHPDSDGFRSSSMSLGRLLAYRALVIVPVLAAGNILLAQLALAGALTWLGLLGCNAMILLLIAIKLRPKVGANLLRHWLSYRQARRHL